MAIVKITFVDSTGAESRSPLSETEALRFAFNGRPPMEYRLSDFPQTIRDLASWHGLKQKIVDSYVGNNGDVAVAAGLAEAMAQRLRDGVWNLGGGVAKESLLALAVAEVTGQEMADVIAKLAEKSKEERAAMRKHPQIKPVLLRMEAERAAAAAAAAEAAADGEQFTL